LKGFTIYTLGDVGPGLDDKVRDGIIGEGLDVNGGSVDDERLYRFVDSFLDSEFAKDMSSARWKDLVNEAGSDFHYN
jgi:hypothetical protein